MNSTVIPKSIQEVMSIPSWKSVMEAEIFALSKNARSLVTRPRGKTAVGCHRVSTMKYLPDGSIECLKANLVGKGYS